MEKYSSEIMCDVPYRNKIYGHLFTKEDELEVEVKKLKERVDKLEKYQIDELKSKMYSMYSTMPFSVYDSLTNAWSI